MNIKEQNFLSFYARMIKKSFGILERFPTKCIKYFFHFFHPLNYESVDE